MPGRGTPWRKGKGRKGRVAEHDIEDDSVESIDIKDGTIQEVDLDSALQAKVNSASGHVIEDEGTPLAQRPNMNFIGAGVVASDDGETTNVTIAGGGGLDLFNLIDPTTEFFFYDDFWYEQNLSTNLSIRYELDTLANGVNGGFNANIGSNTGGGVGLVTVGVENIQSLVLGVSNSPGTDVDVTKKFKLIWRFGTAEIDNAFRMGFNISGGGVGGPLGTFPFGSTIADFIWFRYDGAGNVFAETDNGVTPNSTDTGIAPSTGVRTYEISSVDGSNIVFKIDGSTVATFTTNLPTGSRKIFLALQSPVAGNRLLNVDTLFLYGTR